MGMERSIGGYKNLRGWMRTRYIGNYYAGSNYEHADSCDCG
jgi:hypothetical protein